MIVRSAKKLKKRYQDLRSGDTFLGILTYKHIKESILIDLLERGIFCYPSPLSQVLNHSKAAQAVILKKWMIPHTYVITRRADLIDAVNSFNRLGIAQVVTKEDHRHCGHGVRRWESIEMLYNFLAFSDDSYPFVLQPFWDNFTDVRVIIVSDYTEAYVRHNPNNFRMNISMGGKNYPHEMSLELLDFCRSAMERGKFPYAHMDIQIAQNGTFYLSEIALNGGTKGAKICQKELERKKQELLERLANG